MSKCPLCNTRLHVATCREPEFGLVETIEVCRDVFGCNQYKNHWYYGRRELQVGKWSADFPDHGHIGKAEQAEADMYHQIFERRIPRTRRYFKRAGKWKK